MRRSARLPYTIAKQRSDYGSDVLVSVYIWFIALVLTQDQYYTWTSSATPQINYTEKLNLDYRHFDSSNITPRYEFGYGLSYTTFGYYTLTIKPLIDLTNAIAGSVSPGGLSGLWTNALNVTFFVKNLGSVDGNEVAQLYLVRS